MPTILMAINTCRSRVPELRCCVCAFVHSIDNKLALAIIYTMVCLSLCMSTSLMKCLGEVKLMTSNNWL